jgi:Mn2+/Fe2+ NRAMP family transporter
MMAGLADNDPSGVTTYSIVGALAGYSQLWLLVLATFMVQAVQATFARVGDVTHEGILHLTRRRYGRNLTFVVALLGVLANEATLIADVSALGVSMELLTGFAWQWFVIPSTVGLLVLTVFCNFRWLRNLFLLVGLLLLAYIVAAFLVHPDWKLALRGTFIPLLPNTQAELIAAVALLGTTVSPYLLFWEAEGEREADRGRSTCIIRLIATAADVAAALEPFASNLAAIIFAVGLLGTGLLAMPMFAISIGYIVAEALERPSGLSRTPRQAPVFYSTLILAFLSGSVAVLLGIDPITAMYDSQVLDGLLMPALLVVLARLVNDRHVMGPFRNTRYFNFWLIVSILVMGIAAVALLLCLM